MILLNSSVKIIILIEKLLWRTKDGRIELELSPLSIRILKHQTIQRQANVPAVVGGYSAAALQAGVGFTYTY